MSLAQHKGVHLAARSNGQQHRLQPCRSIFNLFGGSLGTPQVQLETSEPELTKWLQQRGLAVETLKVVPQQLQGQGRGLVATRPIKAGEQILALSESLVLFPPTAAAECVLAPLLSVDAETLPDWTLLVLYLAEQYYYLDRGLPLPSATWAPYLQSLPKHPVGTVLDWPVEEVLKVLSGSGLLLKAQLIMAAADALRGHIQPVISTAKQQGLCPADMFSRAAITWATGICLSRTVRLDDRSGEVVLCPFADLFNHSCDSKAFLLWDPKQRAVVLKADRPYKPGDQVTISYGFTSSGELLLSYGFCPPPGTNPYDAAYLSFAPEITDPAMQEKKQALIRRGLPEIDTFGLLIDALPAGLLPYAAFCSARASNSSAAAVEQLAVQLFDRGELPDIDGVSSEVIALEAVVKQCKAALPGYKQTAAADQQAAEAVAGGGGFAQRAALVAAIRCRERAIIARTEFVASQRIRELRRSSSGRRL